MERAIAFGRLVHVQVYPVTLNQQTTTISVGCHLTTTLSFRSTASLCEQFEPTSLKSSASCRFADQRCSVTSSRFSASPSATNRSLYSTACSLAREAAALAFVRMSDRSSMRLSAFGIRQRQRNQMPSSALCKLPVKKVDSLFTFVKSLNINIWFAVSERVVPTLAVGGFKSNVHQQRQFSPQHFGSRLRINVSRLLLIIDIRAVKL